MSTNCLVTKLKGSVTSDLPKLGIARIYLDDGPSGTRLGFNLFSTTFKAIDNIYFTNSDGTGNLGTEITNTGVAYVSAGTGHVEMPKYAFGSVNFCDHNSAEQRQRISADIAELLGGNQNALAKFDCRDTNLFGDITGLPFETTSDCVFNVQNTKIGGIMPEGIINSYKINIQGTEISMPTELAGRCINVIHLNLSKYCTGDFAELGKAIALEQINSDNNTATVTGSITGFVANAITARRAAGGDGSGTIYVASPLNKFPNVTWLEGITSSTRRFTWDAQGNITMSDS